MASLDYHTFSSSSCRRDCSILARAWVRLDNCCSYPLMVAMCWRGEGGSQSVCMANETVDVTQGSKRTIYPAVPCLLIEQSSLRRTIAWLHCKQGRAIMLEAILECAYLLNFSGLLLHKLLQVSLLLCIQSKEHFIPLLHVHVHTYNNSSTSILPYYCT